MKKLSIFFLLLPLLLLCGIAASAQDKIYLWDGTILQAKVKEVGPRNIIYLKWDNQDGPEYVVTRREVERIKYANGTEEYVETRSGGRFPRRPGRRSSDMRSDSDDDDAEEKPRSRERASVTTPGYGANIISVAPIQMTNESVAGIGISYERMLDRNQMFSLYLPVAVSFFSDETNNPIDKKQRNFTYLYPGVKVYPGGSTRRVSYSVGASIAFGFGTKYKVTETYDPLLGYQTTYKEGSVFKSGFLLNNGLNIQPTKKLYIGLEAGIGFLYTDNERSDFVIGNEPLVQFNFKFGYRF